MKKEKQERKKKERKQSRERRKDNYSEGIICNFSLSKFDSNQLSSISDLEEFNVSIIELVVDSFSSVIRFDLNFFAEFFNA